MELINNNQVPEGYKKTEVGVIPEDWEVVPLKDLIDADRRITYGIVVPGQHTSNGVPMIRAQDYSRGWVDIEDLYRVSPKIDESYKRSRVIPDDILLTIVGSVGNLAKVPSGFRNTNITQQTARLAFNKKAFADFYFNILQSKLGKNVILNYTKSGVQPSLNLSDVEKFNLPYPPLREQKAIAQTLSDVDALIDELDKLIAKKRNIKTGTMQQLLTGKTRLPGFGEGKGYKKSAIGVIPEDWEVDDLGKFITEFRGGAPLKPSDFTNGGVKVLPKGAVVRGGFLKINDKDLQFCSKQYANHYGKNKINNTYIVVVLRDLVPSGPSIGLIVKIKKPEIYILAQGVYGFKTQGIIDEYLIQYSNSFPYRKLMNEIMVGSTQVHITNTAFKAIKLPFPPLPQQKAIAQVLSDIDTEITALEKRRAKTQAIKQGMMQELLTGRTRLKIEHPDDPITKNSNG